MLKAIIVDLDGTLADIAHRLHLIKQSMEECLQSGKDITECQNFKPDWDGFNELCLEDPVIEHNKYIVDHICIDMYLDIFILTGRSDKVKDKTIQWLRKHGIQYDHLIMRKDGDHRQDVEFKLEHVNNIKLTHRIICAFDDRDRVVKMYRDNGIPCLQVAEGTY